jgi:hypothetical protein
MCIHGITVRSLPSSIRECCTHTTDATPSKKGTPKLKLIKAWFCPTLRFTKPVGVVDDNTNTDLDGHAEYSESNANANSRFGSRQADQAGLDYSPDYQGTKALVSLNTEKGRSTAGLQPLSRI